MGGGLRESTKTRVGNGYFGIIWLVMAHKLWVITNVQSEPFHNHFQLWYILELKWMRISNIQIQSIMIFLFSRQPKLLIFGTN